MKISPVKSKGVHRVKIGKCCIFVFKQYSGTIHTSVCCGKIDEIPKLKLKINKVL